jgi:threonine 3-dehydrogenase
MTISVSTGVLALINGDGANGFDIGFECSGAPGTLEVVLRSLRREATAMCVGIPHAPVQLDITRYAIKQGLTIKGSFGRSLWATWDRLAAIITTGRVDLGSLVTHRLPLSGFGDALNLLDADAGKVTSGTKTLPSGYPSSAVLMHVVLVDHALRPGLNCAN